MRYLFLSLLWLLQAGNSNQLSTESAQVRAAYLRLQQAPTAVAARQDYIAAFPATKAVFLRVFSDKDFGQLYDGHEYIEALQRLGNAYPRTVLRKCVRIGKSLVWEADAIGYLQHSTVELGGAHPREFAAEVHLLPLTEQKSLCRFLADVENHRAYSSYATLMQQLRQTGAPDLATLLHEAKTRRMQQPNH